MSEFQYENQGYETMLVYHLGEGEHIDSYAKGMLQGNDLTGILKPLFTQRDMDQYLKFQVSSRITLRDYIGREMERETVLKLCLSMAEAMKELEEYMLGSDKIVLDVDYIFVDIRKKTASLVYLPIDEFSQKYTGKEFLLHMLSHMRFQMDQDVSYVAKLLHFLNQPDAWEYNDLKRFIENLLMDDKKTSKQDTVKAEAAGKKQQVDQSFEQGLQNSGWNMGEFVKGQADQNRLEDGFRPASMPVSSPVRMPLYCQQILCRCQYRRKRADYSQKRKRR